MFDVAEYMLSYIDEKGISHKDLNEINILVDKKLLINQNLTMKNGSVITLNLPLYDYLDEIVERMEMYILEVVKQNGEWKHIEDVKLSTLLSFFELPICPFWLTFCEMVKTSLIEIAYS